MSAARSVGHHLFPHIEHREPGCGETKPDSPDDKAWALEVVGGESYSIVEDARNPPMTDEDKLAISKAIYVCLEHETPFSDIWPTVYASLPQVAGKRTLVDIVEAYDTHDGRARQLSSLLFSK